MNEYLITWKKTNRIANSKNEIIQELKSRHMLQLIEKIEKINKDGSKK